MPARVALPGDGGETAVPERLPLLPLRDVVFFPHATLPLFVGRPRSVAAVESACGEARLLLAVTQRRPETVRPVGRDLHSVGSLLRILQIFRLPDGSLRILAEGLAAVRLSRIRVKEEHLEASFELLTNAGGDDATAASDGSASARSVSARSASALASDVRREFQRYVRRHRRIAPEVALAVRGVRDPDVLSLRVAAHLQVSVEEKQRLLECDSAGARLEALRRLLLADRQREALDQPEHGPAEAGSRDELLDSPGGDRPGGGFAVGTPPDEDQEELAELAEAIEEARMPEQAAERARRELSRLSRMAPISPEATVARTYLDWLIHVPWRDTTRDRRDLARAKRILDEDHFGLDKVKERILEQMAVLKLAREVKGPILCLSGPPGVGKTSLGRSIARALGRRFVRMSLGGVRDESEIRGHRRTYIGSLPGRILQAMRRAGTVNPVLLLDEIDKLGADHRGDPAAALLEVLDPEQNRSFTDHYLEVDYDLSRVLFVTTANTLSAIPDPLRDRMEVIRLPGYTEIEKREIARRYLLPRQREACGLRDGDLAVEEEAWLPLIRGYTREAGVRQLEREIARLCRRTAKVKAGGADPVLAPSADSVPKTDSVRRADSAPKTDSVRGADSAPKTDSVRSADSVRTPDPAAAPATRSTQASASRAGRGRRRGVLGLRMDERRIRALLGAPRFESPPLETAGRVGLATGLAWTSSGGELLQIEVGAYPGRGALLLTGQLGETMRESAQAALSYVRSRQALLGLDSRFHRRTDLHVHVPEGAVPKDGPSAGVTIALAMISALTGLPTRADVALTGEITLRGRVLGVGGLSEKLLAARRAGLAMVLVPGANQTALGEISCQVTEGLTVKPVDSMDEVVELALAHPLRRAAVLSDATSLPRAA